MNLSIMQHACKIKMLWERRVRSVRFFFCRQVRTPQATLSQECAVVCV